jgi:hypothetical protein
VPVTAHQAITVDLVERDDVVARDHRDAAKPERARKQASANSWAE